MTVTSTTFRTAWVAANGVNKNWSYDFFLANQSDVVIQVRDNTTQVITEFTANLTLFKTNDVSGYVLYPASGAAVPTGNSVRVVRRVPYTQEIAIGNEGAFDPEIHEKAFDTMAVQTQQIADGESRSIQVPDGNNAGTMVPDIAEDEILAADGTNGIKGSGWSLATLADTVSDAISSAAAALASQVAAAASAAAALVSQNAAATSATNAATSEANALSYRNTTQGYMTTTQGYRDTALTYQTNAGNSATAAATSATNAATSETNANTSKVAAQSAQTAAEAARDATLAAYDSFDDRYLGAKAAAPTVDNDGNPLAAGMLYYKTTASTGMYVYTGTMWTAAYIDGTGVALLANNGSDYNAASFRTNISVYSQAEINAFGYATLASPTFTGTVTVPDGSFTPAKLNNGSAVSVLGRSANSAGARADITAAADDTILRRTGGAVSFGQLTAGMFPAGVVTYSMLAGAAIASNSEFQLGTASKLLSAAALKATVAYQALTDAATIAWDMSLGNNGSVALAGNRTLGNPSNANPLFGFVLKITATTSTRTLDKGANYVVASGVEAFPISIATTETVFIVGFVDTATRIVITGVVRT